MALDWTPSRHVPGMSTFEIEIGDLHIELQQHKLPTGQVTTGWIAKRNTETGKWTVMWLDNNNLTTLATVLAKLQEES
jgi:hypothetical protein